MRPQARYKLGILLGTLVILGGVLLGTHAGRSLLRTLAGRRSWAVPDELPRLLHVGGGKSARVWSAEMIADTRARLLPTDAPEPFDIIYSLWPDEETSYSLRPILRDHVSKHWDPIALDRPYPNNKYSLRWPEHEDGKIRLVTNEYSMRRDNAVPQEKTGQRVLVIGDSHTYGLVNNDESYPSLLQAQLQAGPGPWNAPAVAFPPASSDSQLAEANQAPAVSPPEVFNVGVSSTGPFEFIGSYLRFQEIQPDVVVCALFTGNDFANVMPFLNHFLGRKPTRWFNHRERLRNAEVRRTFLSPVAQGFSQAHRFNHQFGEAESALDTAVACFLELQRLTSQRNVTLIAAILPTKVDVESNDDREQTDAILAALELTREQYDINRKLAERFAELLREQGVHVVELQASMQAETTPLFWRKDYHLNVDGHAFVARALLESVGSALEELR